MRLGTPEPFGNAGGLLEQRSRRRAFGNKVETAIVVDADDHRDGSPVKFLGAVVKLLNELTQVDAEFTKRSTDRRCGRGLTAGNLEFRISYKLFSHRGRFLPSLARRVTLKVLVVWRVVLGPELRPTPY